MAPLAAGVPASSPQLHGPLSAVGVLIKLAMGLKGTWYSYSFE